MTDTDLGKCIEHLRRQSDVSQLALSQILGKSRGWLRRREKGEIVVSAHDLYRLAQALRVPIDNFSQELS